MGILIEKWLWVCSVLVSVFCTAAFSHNFCQQAAVVEAVWHMGTTTTKTHKKPPPANCQSQYSLNRGSMFLFLFFLLTDTLADFHDSLWNGDPSTVNLKLLVNVLFACILWCGLQSYAVLCNFSITLTLQNFCLDNLSLLPPFPVFYALSVHCGIHSSNKLVALLYCSDSVPELMLLSWLFINVNVL